MLWQTQRLRTSAPQAKRKHRSCRVSVACLNAQRKVLKGPRKQNLTSECKARQMTSPSGPPPPSLPVESKLISLFIGIIFTGGKIWSYGADGLVEAVIERVQNSGVGKGSANFAGSIWSDEQTTVPGRFPCCSVAPAYSEAAYSEFSMCFHISSSAS